MALSKLRSINKLKDPLRQYQCKFHISRGVGTSLANATGELMNNHHSILRKEDFELRATSWTYPGTVIKTTDTVIFNHYRRRPTLQDKSGTWKVSVTEDMNGSVLQSIHDWCDTIMNPYTGLMLPSETYIGMAAVEICDQNLKSKKRLFLRGFYPTKINEIRIDPSSSQVVTVDIEFNYDWYSEWNLVGGKYTIAGEGDSETAELFGMQIFGF